MATKWEYSLEPIEPLPAGQDFEDKFQIRGEHIIKIHVLIV
jgi:hypothetical protein